MTTEPQRNNIQPGMFVRFKNDRFATETICKGWSLLLQLYRAGDIGQVVYANGPYWCVQINNADGPVVACREHEIEKCDTAALWSHAGQTYFEATGG